MDPVTTFAVVVMLVVLVVILSLVLFELRAQAHERDQFEKALLMALFRISKQGIDKHRALAAVLLRSLRRTGVAAEQDVTATLTGPVEPAALPSGSPESLSDEGSDPTTRANERKP